MKNEITSLDRFATLNKICSSEDTFIRFYKKELLNKKLSVWNREVREIFEDIASSLRSSSTTNDTSAAVGYRYKMLLVLQRKINNLKASIDINKENYQLYRNAPDVLFGPTMESDMTKFNKPYDEVASVHRKYMERRLSVLTLISPFVDACNSIVGQAKRDFKSEFSIYLSGSVDLSKRKFKTDLTVPQLAYFFKMLLQKGVVSEDTKMELYRAIADSFSTPKAKDLSESSLKNKFEAPEVDTMKFVASLFERLATAAKKDSEKAQQ